MVTKSDLYQIMEQADTRGFFKFLLPSDLLSESMRMIPNDFTKTISDEDLSGNMVLKLASGRSWTLKICRNPRFYSMDQSGWEQFLRDNDLGNNEFVDFHHEGHMCFTLDIDPTDTVTVASSSSGNIDKDVNTEETESNFSGLKTDESTGTRQRLNLGNKKTDRDASRSL